MTYFQVRIRMYFANATSINRNNLTMDLSMQQTIEPVVLDPVLTALQQSLQQAWDTNPDHYLPVNAQTIGTGGAAIITLFQSNLNITGYTLTGNISITPDTNDNTLTVAGDSADTIIAIGGPTLTAVFSVVNQQLEIELTLAAQDPWTFADTFPAFANTWFAQLNFVDTDTIFPVFILSGIQHTVPNGTIQAGLNFSAQLNLQPPWNILLSLVTNAPNPLPLLGKVVVNDPVTTSTNLLAALPSFSFNVPGIKTLAFNNPGFGVNGLATVYDSVNYLQLDCFVMADITLDGYTLPLAARLPIGGSQPLLMLQPGKQVALAEIAGFFTALFTGSAPGVLSAALPTFLDTLLNKFSLTGFVVTLKGDWSGFDGITLSIASTNAPDTVLWPLLPGVFELKEAGIAIQLQPAAGNTYATSGSIWGSVAVGQSLLIGTVIPLPVGSGEWIFSASAANAIPNLGQFAQFLGGDKLGGLLPAHLADVGGFSLTNLTIKYNPATQTLTSLSIALITDNTWTIIENWFLVKQLSLQMQVNTPLTSPQLIGNFTGTLIIGSIGVTVSIQRAVPTADWMLQVQTTSIVLPSLGDMTQLLGGTQLVNVLPNSIVQNHFNLDDLTISINISQQKLNILSFLLDSPDQWDIITGLLAINKPGVYLNFDWTNPPGVAITGRIYGDLIFAGADFYVEAVKNTDSWDLSASLQENTPLTLFNAADAIIPNSSQQLATLGAPNIVLSVANITYHTKDKSYELEGVVNINDPVKNQPWSFNVGQTGIAIKDIGIKVTSKQGDNKEPQGTKVFLKGTLQIGANITFNITYEVGGDLVIKGTLVEAGQYVSLKDLVSGLCNPDASHVSWTSAFESLDQVRFTNVQLSFTIGTNPSFQVYGTMLIAGVQVDAVFVLTRQTTWNFVVGVKVSMSPNWSIPGFTNTLSTFNLQQATFALVISSFDNPYTLPPAIGITEVTSVAKGLNFYAAFQISETDNRFQAAKAVLPTGVLPVQTSLVIQGLITDPLDKSYVEVVLNSVAGGLPLMGWEAVRLKKFSLRLYAEPAIALHGEFIMTMITDAQNNYLILAIDLKASVSEIAIVFIPSMPFKDRPVIIAWVNALGITGLTFYLTDLELGIKPFAGPALTGTVGGGIDFTSSQHPGVVHAAAAIVQPNTVMAGRLPDPVIVQELHRKSALQLMSANGTTTFCDMNAPINLSQPIDTNIRVEGKIGFLIVPESPEPVIPNKVGLRMVNFTLPYMLRRFANITLPEVLFPVLFPDICFYVSFDPTKPSKTLEFEFNGQIVVFGFHGHIAAQCNQNRIYLNAGMDPVAFAVNGSNLLVIQRSATDAANGPFVIIDSAPVKPEDPNLSAALYCNFFDFILFQGTALVKVDQHNIADSYFYFDMAGSAGSLANMQLHLEYQKAKYLNITGSFALFLDTAHIPGFDITNNNNNQTVRAADQIDLSKMPGQGVDLAATFTMILDNRGITPNFTLNGSGGFRVHVGPCDIPLTLQFNVGSVNANTISQLPATIASQMMANAASIFTAMYRTAECFAELVKLGVIIFNDAVEAAKVLAKFFVTGIDLASKLLDELGNDVEKVADWLWNIFDSKDSEKNTKALKDNTNYSDDDIARAVKDTAGPTYTAEMLIRDQAYAGYNATQAAGALVKNFSQYNNDPVNTGKLLKAKYSYLQIAPALHTQFPSYTSKAEDMYTVLQQVFTSTLTAQQMANALALIYPAKDVARALRTHYPPDTDTAPKMATLLLTAYQQAGHPLLVNDLAGALAPLYSAAAVAKVLKDNFPDQTGTPGAMAGILQTAYTAAGITLQAADMTGALANAPYEAKLVAPVIHTRYPNDTQTALQMAQLLYAAYPAIQSNPGDMAVALAAVPYPAAGIATALQTLYQQQVQHAAQMAALLAQAQVLPKDAAPVLKQLYPTETATPQQMISILLTAYQATPITFTNMAAALAAAPYDAADTAPALHTQYPLQTQTAADMLTGLQQAYTNPAITVAVMMKALKACTYPISDIAATIKQHYATDVPHALQMAQLLAQAPPVTAADAAPVLQTLYPADTNTAPLLAAVLAQAPYLPHDVAPVIKHLFPLAVQKATDMYSLLVTAYHPTVITAPQMAAALANAPYDAVEVSPVLKTNYPADTGTPALMAALLNTAYTTPLTTAQMTAALAKAPYIVKDVATFLVSQTTYAPDVNTATKLANVLYNAYQPGIQVADMLGALAAVHYNAYESAAPVKSLFTAATPAELAVALVATWQPIAPLGSLTLGLALQSASVAQNDLVVAVHTALPAVTAGEMAALLVIAYSTNITAALSAADSNKVSGKNIIATGPIITQNIPAITPPELAGALVSVFTPPNTVTDDLSKALCKSYTTPSATGIASGIMAAFPATDANGLAATLTTGYSFIGQTLSTDAMAAAIVAGFTFIGKDITETQLAQLLVAKYPGLTPLAAAKAIVGAYGAANTTVAKVLDGLFAGFPTLTPLQSAVALQQSFSLPQDQAKAIAQPLVPKFSLTQLPNHVGCISLAMKAAGFPLTAVSGAFGIIYSPDWNAADYTILSNVYTGQTWASLLPLVNAGKTAVEAAQSLKTTYPSLLPGDMCPLLAAGFYLVHVNTAVRPMAIAMKAAGYTLVQTAGAMGIQYTPGWTAADYAIVVDVYKS
ncbi:hypothetical protein HB364_29255 [Pseudoflavitalea sp. X16]|uniref:hypothetical protein n=1 Tax=Paraflavitalea devenefica TaxID=2716334 RepID=UPI001421B92A|nr:hypothetical protein [Paraflavitalea devenefica]NII29203.1 hypothetical protein [Paraflavitalea devenefica]